MVNTSGCLLGETPDATEELWVFFVDVGSEVTTVVKDQVQRLATGETLDGLVNTPDILLLGLTLPGEDGNTSSGDGGGGMVLSGEDVLERRSDPRSPTAGHRRLKRTQEDQVTSAPRAVRVSIKTAV